MNHDIVTRLRRWTHAADAVPASDLMDEAADEIERLRRTNAEREAVAWIPVTDRMPPDGALVFAYGKRPEYGFRRDGQWIDTLYGGVLADGPTHWMPMPPPPTDAK